VSELLFPAGLARVDSTGLPGCEDAVW